MSGATKTTAFPEIQRRSDDDTSSSTYNPRSLPRETYVEYVCTKRVPEFHGTARRHTCDTPLKHAESPSVTELKAASLQDKEPKQFPEATSAVIAAEA